VLAVEPNIETLPQKLGKPNLLLTSLTDVLSTADVLSVLVKHKPFIDAVKDIRQHGHVIDAVGLF
jgi:UDP-N-acetyl-D-mannosaminuronic acid dehydrogenase